MIALRFRYAHNLRHEARVEKHALPARYRIRADEWVLRGDGFAAHSTAQVAGALGLQVG